jgi:hypothetical protein
MQVLYEAAPLALQGHTCAFSKQLIVADANSLLSGLTIDAHRAFRARVKGVGNLWV